MNTNCLALSLIRGTGIVTPKNLRYLDQPDSALSEAF